jgi:hypothetical protein
VNQWIRNAQNFVMNTWKSRFVLAALWLVMGGMGSGAMAQQIPGLGNLDPQQIQQFIQQRLVEYFRDRLKVTDDAEWKVIEERLMKVVKIKAETLFTGGGFAGMPLGRNQAVGRALSGLFEVNPETENIQKAIAANASNAQYHAVLARYREIRQKKEADLGKAQDELRKVLSLRQEATLVLDGLLE